MAIFTQFSGLRIEEHWFQKTVGESTSFRSDKKTEKEFLLQEPVRHRWLLISLCKNRRTPACCKTWSLTISATSCATSASRMLLSSSYIVITGYRKKFIACERRLSAAPRLPRLELSDVMAELIAVSAFVAADCAFVVVSAIME